MGNQNSTSTMDVTQQEQLANDKNNSAESSAANDPELRAIRRSLKRDPELFILNNLTLCVQFFENYEREILDIRSTEVSRSEDDMNIFLSQSQKHILLPGVLEEQVSRHVKFTSTRRTDFESTLEPIQPVRMYVVLDNFNVNVNDVAERSNNITSADSICYKMGLEPSSKHGYVKLRCLEATATMKEQSTESSEPDLPFIVEDDDEREDTSVTSKSAYTQSMTNLYNVDGDNGETAPLKMGKTLSQTNLTLPALPDDEGYQEPPYSGTSESRLSGPLKQVKQSKVRLQSMHQLQHRRSIESTPRSSRSSGYKSSSSSGRNSVTESEYGYAVSTISSTVSEADLAVSSSEIPASCFKKFVCTCGGKVYSEKAEKKKSRNPRDKRIRKAERSQNESRLYFGSHKFRRYFKNLFVNRLAKPLGFEIEDDTDVTRQGAIIHCYSMEVIEGSPTFVIPHEIVPSISAEWPKFCSEWLERSRSAILNSPNKDTWLRGEMIDKIEQLGCHIIPASYMPTRKTKPYHTVEWQVNFPAAERYLETCLSHSQARVYMMALMLHKRFIRSTDPAFEFSKSYIRSQLFWLLEQNYSPSMWSENSAGESLRELLKKLYSAVSQSQPCLGDYFISKKNLFANIPRQYLHLTQKQLKRIIENPVMYMIASMKSIRYKPEFFPVMDYKRLFTLLVLDDEDLPAFLNPALSSVDGPMSKPETEEIMEIEEQFDHIGEFGVEEQTKDDPLYERGQKCIQQKNVINKSNNVCQDLVVEIPYQCAELRELRLTAFLDMFIEHFTKMAERCYHYGAMEQKTIYLNQAQRLSMILREQAHGKENAERYLDTIKTLKHRLSRFNAQEGGAETLARSDLSTISVPLNQYFIDESNGQEHTLFMPGNGEANKSDVHHTYVESQSNVDSQVQKETTL